MASSISSAALASASLESQLKISSSMMNIHAVRLGNVTPPNNEDNEQEEEELDYQMQTKRLRIHDDDDGGGYDDDEVRIEEDAVQQRHDSPQRMYSTSYDPSGSFLSSSTSAKKTQAAVLSLVTTIVATDTVPINVVKTPELQSWKEQRGRFQIHHQRYSSETSVGLPMKYSNNRNNHNNSSNNNPVPDSPSGALAAEKFSDHKQKLGAFSMSMLRPSGGSMSQEQIKTFMGHSASSNSLTTNEKDKKEGDGVGAGAGQVALSEPKQPVDKSLHHSSSFDHALALTGQEQTAGTVKQRIYSSALSSSSTRTPTNTTTSSANAASASKGQYTSPGRWHMAKMNRETLKQSADKFVLVKGRDGGYVMAYELGASIATTDEGPTPRVSMEENVTANVNQK